ncbi:hypothetical protein FRC10_010357, partial [Ceratobasidium sp. 414]
MHWLQPPRRGISIMPRITMTQEPAPVLPMHVSTSSCPPGDPNLEEDFVEGAIVSEHTEDVAGDGDITRNPEAATISEHEATGTSGIDCTISNNPARRVNPEIGDSTACDMISDSHVVHVRNDVGTSSAISIGDNSVISISDNSSISISNKLVISISDSLTTSSNGDPFEGDLEVDSEPD